MKKLDRDEKIERMYVVGIVAIVVSLVWVIAASVLFESGDGGFNFLPYLPALILFVAGVVIVIVAKATHSGPLTSYGEDEKDKKIKELEEKVDELSKDKK